MWSKALMYVTGFERGVLPIGLWSTRTTSEIHFMPVSMTPVPETGSAPCRVAFMDSNKHSWTNVDLPDPETPVMHVIKPSGISTSIFFRLCLAAFLSLIVLGPGNRRFFGLETFSSPLRYLPVSEAVHFVTPSSLP